jgi:hypothetical protein
MVARGIHSPAKNIRTKNRTAPKAATARMTTRTAVVACRARFSRIWAVSSVRGRTGVVDIRRSTPCSR